MKKLILLLTVLLLPAAGFAQTGGKTGSLDWSYDGSGTLTVSGNGAMPDYGNGNSP